MQLVFMIRALNKGPYHENQLHEFRTNCIFVNAATRGGGGGDRTKLQRKPQAENRPKPNTLGPKP